MPVGAVIGGVVGAAGSVGSALIGSNAAQNASDAQVAMDQQALALQEKNANKALALQTSAENTALQAQAPYNDIGTGAAHSLADLYGISYAGQGTGLASTSPNGVITPANSNAPKSSAGGQNVANAAMANFTNTPDYNFAFTQGLQALDRSAAAKGTLMSGGQVKGAEEFGSGLASQQYGNYFNRLLSLAQIGQGAATGTASTALNASSAQAGTLGQAASLQGNTLQGIGTAQAAGDVGSANALSAGLTGIGSNITNSLILSKLGAQGGAGAPSTLSAYTPANNNTNSSSLWNYDINQAGTNF